MDVLAALPREIREEMMHRYGLSDGGWGKGEVIELSDDEDSVGDAVFVDPAAIAVNTEREEPSLEENGSQTRLAREPVSPTPRRQPSPRADGTVNGRAVSLGSQALGEQEVDGEHHGFDSGSDNQDDEDGGTCRRCGTYVFGFAVDAHARWHQQTEIEET
jgi:hypothetical protein